MRQALSARSAKAPHGLHRTDQLRELHVIQPSVVPNPAAQIDAERFHSPDGLRQVPRLESTRQPHRPTALLADRTAYSHSMVPGGLLVMSSTTRLIPRTSFVMRVEIFSNRS